jgi:hypothetical protein
VLPPVSGLLLVARPVATSHGQGRLSARRGACPVNSASTQAVIERYLRRTAAYRSCQ